MKHRWWLTVAAALASLLVVAALTIRTYQASVEQDHVKTLCLTLEQLVHDSDSHLAAISYYQQHPAELAAARAQNAATIKKLNCGAL